VSGYASWDGVGDFEVVGVVRVATGMGVGFGRGMFLGLLLRCGGGKVVNSEGVAGGDVDACR
jgi:hypothetical protein